MSAPATHLLDTDTLSEVIKDRDLRVRQAARQYLETHGSFTFSIITRYEVLRGLKARGATRQVAAFEHWCQTSNVLPLGDDVVVRAADLYADLYRSGHLISDADILIAATALVHGLILITGNVAHFQHISGLPLASWRTP
jgi:tRNA(fMet)-specific endonuclease VapC